MDVTAIVAAVATGGIHPGTLLLVPLAAAVTQQLAEWLGAQYVENQREQTRARQEALMKTNIAVPLGQWLEEWPVAKRGRAPSKEVRRVVPTKEV